MDQMHVRYHEANNDGEENYDSDADSEESGMSLGLLFERFDEDDEEKQNENFKRGPSPRIHWSRIQMDYLLGQGSFSRVYKVHLKATPDSHSSLPQENRLQRKTSLHFALKCPKTKGPAFSPNSSFLSDTLLDLAIETEILSRCCHRNIVRLHGVVRLCGYTLPLLELLQTETLGDYILKWRSQDAKHVNCLCLFECFDTLPSSEPKTKSIQPDTIDKMMHRIEQVALGVAHGMMYLHENQIVLRDLKPENIGFDMNGIPKIFDFGFARNIIELQKQYQEDIGNYEVAGTLVYMPPEALTGVGALPDLSSDVYAFAMVLWEVCTLTRVTTESTRRSPNLVQKIRRRMISKTAVDCGWGQFGMVVKTHDGNEHNLFTTDDVGRSCKAVTQQGMYWQPSVSAIPLPRIKRLILECWSLCPTSRPDFDRIVKVLRLAVKHVALTTEYSSNGTAPTQLSDGSFSGGKVTQSQEPDANSRNVDKMEPVHAKSSRNVKAPLSEYAKIGSGPVNQVNSTTEVKDSSPTVIIHQGNNDDATEVDVLLLDKTQKKQRRRSRLRLRGHWFRWLKSPREYEAFKSNRTTSAHGK